MAANRVTPCRKSPSARAANSQAASRLPATQASRRRSPPACAGSRRTAARTGGRRLAKQNRAQGRGRKIRRSVPRSADSSPRSASTRGSALNSEIHACGQIAAATPDRFGDRERDRPARHRDAQRAFALAGADIGADHCHQRRAEPEHERDQQIFQPRRRAIAGRGRPAGGGDQGGRERDDHVGLHRGDGRDRAHAQDVAKQWPAQRATGRKRATLRPDRMYQVSTAVPPA